MWNFIAENAVNIMAIFGGAQAVARMTPTKKDDEITSMVGKVLNFVFSKTNTRN